MKRETFVFNGINYHVSYGEEFSRDSIERYLKLQPLVPERHDNERERLEFDVLVEMCAHDFRKVSFTPKGYIPEFEGNGSPRGVYDISLSSPKVNSKRFEQGAHLFLPFEKLIFSYSLDSFLPL